MGKIKVTQCGDIEGLKVIEPTVFGDSRGYFMETYNYNDFKEAGIDVEFVQDNQSSSRYGVLRGLHFQISYPQDKLVRVVNGEVFDVAVDLRLQDFWKMVWRSPFRRKQETVLYPEGICSWLPGTFRECRVHLQVF